jgi:hypothetical protein
MEALKGIIYMTSGGRRYVRIDLDMNKDNELLEDFLDLIDIEACKDEPKKPLRSIIMEQNQKRGTNVQRNCK